jgi:hypothetical protein
VLKLVACFLIENFPGERGLSINISSDLLDPSQETRFTIFGGVNSSKLDRGDVMRKFVAFAVAAVVAAGSTAAMAQCQSCQQSQVFAQPVYSAPVASAPVYSAPVYAAPVQSEIAYSAPVVESAPVMSYESAPVASSGCCGCCSGGGAVAGTVVEGGMSYDSSMSYGGEQTLTVGSVINGETVVSVGESVVESVVEGSDSASDDGGTAIEGAVEPTSDGGEIVAPPSDDEEGEVTPPAPDEA